MSIAQAKGDRGKADKIFSLLIRSTMYCERCGARCPCEVAPKKHTQGCPLTCSHIVGRTTSWTRTLLDNAQCLCFKCHAEFTADPVAFTKWLESTIGLEEYYRLKQISNEGIGTKFDWAAEVIRLKGLQKEMEAGTWHRSAVSGEGLV